jgi:hypothetical protein
MRSVYVVSVLVVVLLTAGCATVLPSAESPSDGEPTATGPPSPTAGEPAPSTPPASDPISVPGVSSDGVDVDRLLEAHNGSLQGRAYTFSLATVRGGARRQVDLQREAGGTPAFLVRNGTDGLREEYFSDRAYQRFVTNGTVSYNTALYTRPPPYTGLSVLRTEMRQATYEPAGVATRDGVEVLVLTANRSDLAPNAFGGANITQFGSRVLVDRNGTVRSFRLRATGSIDGGLFFWQTEMRVTDITTTTVPEPDWVPRLRNETAAENGTATPTDTG